MKKLMAMMLTGALLAGTLAGCGTNAGNKAKANTPADSAFNFDTSEYISSISREDGSGTRGAFIELFGIEQKDENGEKIDNTTDEAVITNSTEVMLTSVSGNEYAIGYVSLGSLNNSVKTLNIDANEATAENIKNGSYTISRPFNIATKDSVSEPAQDFINFILSAEGQQVIEAKGYISIAENAAAFTSTNPTGKIVVAGSSSVTPVMEKLKEAYLAINAGTQIEIQESDSTTGMTAAMEGTCDIGMASRELKDSEAEGGLTNTVIAMDGIAVIVNLKNPLDNLTTEDVMNIYTGEYETWDSLIK